MRVGRAAGLLASGTPEEHLRIEALLPKHKTWLARSG